jgi:hypothetical protein
MSKLFGFNSRSESQRERSLRDRIPTEPQLYPSQSLELCLVDLRFRFTRLASAGTVQSGFRSTHAASLVIFSIASTRSCTPPKSLEMTARTPAACAKVQSWSDANMVNRISPHSGMEAEMTLPNRRCYRRMLVSSAIVAVWKEVLSDCGTDHIVIKGHGVSPRTCSNVVFGSDLCCDGRHRALSLCGRQRTSSWLVMQSTNATEAATN